MMKHALTLLFAAFSLTTLLGQKQSVWLDGVDDFVTLDCPLVSNNFLLSFDVNLTSLPSSGSYLFDGRLDDKRGYYMFVRQNGLTDVGWENGLNNYHFEQVDLGDVSWINEWNHVVVVQTGASLQLLIQGVLRAEVPGVLDAIDVRESTLLGRRNDGPGHDLHGSLDNIYIGSNAIEPSDIGRSVCLGFVDDLAAGFWGFNEGAIASQGTNPSAVATLNNGASLTDLNAGLNCGEGICLSGTVWNEEEEGCVVANPADTNLDGCVQLNDLLDVLSAYGDCGVEESPWQCGDPLEYQGYDYETVQIGEQCWFAENLRAENYRNGDSIPFGLTNGEWSAATNGARAVYGDDNLNVLTFGYMYNWTSTSDERGLCPMGWHVPAHEDHMNLITELNQSVDGCEYITQSEGLSMKLGGYRKNDGSYTNLNVAGYYWSATPESVGKSWGFAVFPSQCQEDGELTNDLFTWGHWLQEGFSIRCIQDAE